jgi:glycerophosphoryl diester phosphodiesterase
MSKTTMILGHRGGKKFGPDNSLKAFRGALENNLEGIEFDVWLAADNVPVIIHGGEDGELPDRPEEYVFEWTSDELKEVDIGGGHRIPTLQQLLELSYENKTTFLNIELKGPMDPRYKERYDFDAAAETVMDLVSIYGLEKRVMISSFVGEILVAVGRVKEK